MTETSTVPAICPPLLIRGGRLLDPHNNRDEVADLYIENGRIQAVPEQFEGVRVLEAQGCLVTPGWIDMHVHLREPGGEEAETIETGGLGAARGGFTSVVPMPNTTPPTDTPERVREILAKAQVAGHVRVLPSACLTQQRGGRTVSDMPALFEAGAIVFTDDGCTPPSEEVMKAAMQAAAKIPCPVVDHAQDPEAEKKGVMHEGKYSERFNLPGIPTEAELRIVARDIRLAQETGCHIHIQHVSSGAGVELIRRAQQSGLPVSGEATPHHLTLCDADIDPNNADYKMNPPLRSKKDREAIREGLADGTLSVMATDHAPHPAAKKALGFVEGPFGILGFETAAGVTYTELVLPGHLDLMTWVARWTTGPAAILKRPVPSLAIGAVADVAVFDVDTPWIVDPETFASKSTNTPFAHKGLRGRARWTILEGRITHELSL